MARTEAPRTEAAPRTGRGPGDMRPVVLDRGAVGYAEGSCLVAFGSTRVLCAASIEEGVPGWRRGSGQGWLTAEYAMLPRATLTRTARERGAGGPGGRTQEIQRLIGRSVPRHARRVLVRRVHRPRGLRRAAGRRRYTNGGDHRRVCGRDRRVRLARRARTAGAVAGAAAGGGGQCRHRGWRAPARPRVHGGCARGCRHERRDGVRGPGCRTGCIASRWGPVRGGAGHRGAQHVRPGATRRSAGARGVGDRAAGCGATAGARRARASGAGHQ